MSRLKIGMLADMYLPHISGVTNHISLYRTALEALGHEVTVFTYGRGPQGPEPGVVRSPGIAWGGTGWNWPLPLAPDARRQLRGLDVAHAHHPFASCLEALHHCGSHGVPVVFTNHTRYDLYSDTYTSWIPSPVRHGAIRKYLQWLNRHVSLTLSPSADLAAWLESYGASGNRIRVFPNAIDTVPFARPRAPRSKQDLGLSPDAFVLAYVGRVAREKNVGLLLDAFAEAARADERLALVLIGDGPSRQACERFVSEEGLGDRVRFLGMTPYEDVPGVLAAADAFATASVTEMYPLVVVEACAAGLPVVGVRSPGVGEIVTHGASGLLVTEDASEVAAAMRRVAGDPALHAELQRGAREVARAHAIDESARRLAAIYTELIESARQ